MASARTLRRRLVAELERRGSIESAAVRRAFLDVPREAFVAEFAAREGLEAAYRNDVIVTQRDVHGMPTSSSSQPALMAQMLERLDVREGQRVLEIGAGTGYNAALLASMVGPRGKVVSVELDPPIARQARKALAVTGHRARVVTGDGRDGATGAPFDRIMVTASISEIPRPWFEQLIEGGLLELPLSLAQDELQVVATLRKERAALRSVAVVCGSFMPLRGGGWSPFPFPIHVSAGEFVHTTPVQTLQLCGTAIARLSSAARKRLLVIALSEVRSRRLEHRQPRRSPAPFLSLSIPSRQRIHGWVGSIDRRSVGVVSRDGASLALARGDRIDAYGGGEAEELLLRRLAMWKERGRPAEEELSLEVDFRFDSPRLRWRWPSARRDGRPPASAP